MKANHILITVSIITIILTLLWYFEVIGEPIAALGGAVLTFMSYILSYKMNTDTKEEEHSTGKKPTIINQTHSGTGDNIGGDKIVNN